MVRNFKGVVKVADVQAEFDALLTRINNAIDRYNEGLELSGDIDYNNGGADLAPLGYTLSIGGLKKVLNAYDGSLLGGMVFKVSNGNYLISEGLYIKDNAVHRLPSKALSGDGNKVYYNESSHQYTFEAQGESRIYPNTDNDIVCTPGTYPLTIYDEDYNITNTTITFNTSQVAKKYISNIITNKMQNSTCKMTTYKTFQGQYDWPNLTPSCLIDPSSPQYNDVYNLNVTGNADSGRSNFIAVIPQDMDQGSYFVYGIKMEIEFTETPSSSQTVYLSVSYPGGSNSTSFQYWRLQLFAYDGNDNLVKTGEISTGGAYTSYASISGLDSSVRKIILCAITNDHFGSVVNTIGSLYTQGREIKVTNPYANQYVNLDIDCCLTYITNTDEYSIESYNESYNTLLGSAHFTSGTDHLEYITLENSGGGEVVGNIPVSNINKNRIARLCNRPNATNEEIPGYVVKVESKALGVGNNELLSNSDKGQFVGGVAGRNCNINLFGVGVSAHSYYSDRSDSYWEPFNYLFVPKGIPNPYSSITGETRYASQKVWNYILERPSR